MASEADSVDPGIDPVGSGTDPAGSRTEPVNDFFSLDICVPDSCILTYFCLRQLHPDIRLSQTVVN